jgi:hypothetical protein
MASVSVRVVYEKRNLSSTMDDVPLTSSIRAVKSLISQINDMESPDPIQVSFADRVLDDSESLADIVGDVTDVTIAATGVVIKGSVPEDPPEPARCPCCFWVILVIILFHVLVVIFFSFVAVAGDPKALGRVGEPELEVRRRSVFFAALTAIVVLALLIRILTRCIWTPTVRECAVEFVASFAPGWDREKFRRRHRVR